MPLVDSLYKTNQTIVKLYDNGLHKKVKVIKMNKLRTSGVEDENNEKKRGKRCSVNEYKLDNNIMRTKNKIFELAFCNLWEYFFTATLNSKLYDRTNLKKFHKDLTQWFRDQGKKFNCKIDFLLIPELHSDGKSWHMHGLIMGLPVEQLKQFCIGDKMSKEIVKKVRNGEVVYNWPAYEKKFGFCDLEPIHSFEGCCKYITKYICKDLENCVKELNANMYFRSKGLNTAKTLKKGTLLTDLKPDYENEYCKISWIDYDEEVINSLLDSFVNERIESIYDYIEDFYNDDAAGF